MPYVLTPSGARYHYELYGDGAEKVMFIAGFACCKAYWKAPVSELLKKGEILQSKKQQSENNTTTQSSNQANGHSHTQSNSHSKAHRNHSHNHSHNHSNGSSNGHSRNHKSHQPKNHYQICVFDTRGFGKSTIGSYQRMSTHNMAVDVLHILLHLGWVSCQSIQSPYYTTPSYDHAPLPRHVHQSASPPILHIAAWSLGGMVTQELSAMLSNPASQLRHSLRSLVYTSSSPGGLLDPHERSWAYLCRNQPPWAGYKCIAGMILGSFTHHQRISYAVKLHFSEDYLKKPYTGEWPLRDTEECFCEDDCDRAKVRALHSQVHESNSSPRSTSTPLQFPSKRPETNRELLAYMYTQRSPFDRHISASLWALFQNVLAVYTHAFDHHKAQEFHSYNRRNSITEDESDAQSMVHVQPLVVTGDADILISHSNSIALAHYLDCECLLIKHSGHMMYIEHPQLYADVLHTHFARSAKKQHSSFVGMFPSDQVEVITSETNPRTIQLRTEQQASKQKLLDGESPSATFSWKSLLISVMLFKVLQSMRDIKWANVPASFVEAFKPVMLLYWHLRSVLIMRMQQILALLKASLL